MEDNHHLFTLEGLNKRTDIVNVLLANEVIHDDRMKKSTTKTKLGHFDSLLSHAIAIQDRNHVANTQNIPIEFDRILIDGRKHEGEGTVRGSKPGRGSVSNPPILNPPIEGSQSMLSDNVEHRRSSSDNLVEVRDQDGILTSEIGLLDKEGIGKNYYFLYSFYLS